MSDKEWGYISLNQTLTEDFIREFENKVNWRFISSNQKLSKGFIVEFSDKLNFKDLLINNHLSDEVKEFCRMFI